MIANYCAPSTPCCRPIRHYARPQQFAALVLPTRPWSDACERNSRRSRHYQQAPLNQRSRAVTRCKGQKRRRNDLARHCPRFLQHSRTPVERRRSRYSRLSQLRPHPPPLTILRSRMQQAPRQMLLPSANHLLRRPLPTRSSKPCASPPRPPLRCHVSISIASPLPPRPTQ